MRGPQDLMQLNLLPAFETLDFIGDLPLNSQTFVSVANIFL
jgi:hypothetical protein